MQIRAAPTGVGMLHPSDVEVSCRCGRTVARPWQHFTYAQLFAAHDGGRHRGLQDCRPGADHARKTIAVMSALPRKAARADILVRPGHPTTDDKDDALARGLQPAAPTCRRSRYQSRAPPVTAVAGREPQDGSATSPVAPFPSAHAPKANVAWPAAAPNGKPPRYLQPFERCFPAARAASPVSRQMP